jgi:uncharacterized SAM-binding protein YcdF (DUF218 family)
MRIYSESINMPKDAEIAVALGAGITPGGVLTARSLARCEAVVPLYDGSHPDSRVIYSGGYTGCSSISEAEAMARHASSFLPPDSNKKPFVAIEQHSRNTCENIINTALLIGGVSAGSCVALVTDRIHMTRTLQYVEAFWPRSLAIVPVIAAYNPAVKERLHEVVGRRIVTTTIRRQRTR